MAGAGIAENLENIRARIAQAAGKAGRDPAEVTLIAVSKTVEVDAVRRAIAAGVTVFGESYLQEARAKIPQITAPVRWDFIGHLQRNKVRHAVGLFQMIHSVDSLSLARDINLAAGKRGEKARILVEVNVSGETTKSGIDPQGAGSLMQELIALPHLSVEGLMTMAPYSDDPEDARPFFRALKQLQDALNERPGPALNLKELSMGMSSDFEVAIEEGSTMVRIGTAIFGERA
jgi:pyridoxal phosphate enzyme (YggS family)